MREGGSGGSGGWGGVGPGCEDAWLEAMAKPFIHEGPETQRLEDLHLWESTIRRAE